MERISFVDKFSAVLAACLLSGYTLADNTARMSGTEYSASPYAGMYGSMGNVYSPYYRKFHTPGMIGMYGPHSLPVIPEAGMSAPGYITSPYSGMYGSMGNVYSPYYRRYHRPFPPGMSGMRQFQSTPPMTKPEGMHGMESTVPKDISTQSMQGIPTMGGMSGYFHITPDGQIFYYPQPMTGISGR